MSERDVFYPESRIFVVDDNESIRDLLYGILASRGYINVEKYEDGQKALEIITDPQNEQIPDLVLLDLKMPRLSGQEFLQKIDNRFQNELLKSKRPEIIVISALAEDILNQELPQSIVFAALKKPVEATNLENVINDALIFHHSSRPLLAPEEGLLSDDLLEILERAQRRSYLLATFDAAREAGVDEKDLKLEEELEQEILEIVETAQKAGIDNYSREDAIQALLQEYHHHNIE